MNPYDYYITPEEYERAAAIGVNNQMLDRRIRLLGWSKEKAITTPIREQKPKGFYTKWAAIAKQNGIKQATFMSRIRKLGWPPEKAATQPLPSPKGIRQCALRAVNHMRVYPEEYLRLAEKNGIPYPTFQRRVKYLGWSYERAATEPIWTPQEKGKLGAKRLRDQEGDWAALIFGKHHSVKGGETVETSC